MALHVKKGDMVKIIAGDCKGATGRVLRVIPGQNKVVVQGQNVANKHVKPSRKNPRGGRISVEQPIQISNVLPLNPKDSKATRVSYRLGKDGSKVRLGADGTEMGLVRRAR
jgi:large subunit ribosomal protein L24